MTSLILLCGGLGEERYLSMLSAENVLTSFKEDKDTDLRLLEWLPSDRWIEYSPNSLDSIQNEYLTLSDYTRLNTDSIYINLLHDPSGVDGSLAAFFQLSRLAYIGNPHDSDIRTNDKRWNKLLFKQAGLKTPESLLLYNSLKENRDALLDLGSCIGYPCFFKPAISGSSLGISLIQNAEELLHLQNDLDWDNCFLEKAISGEEYNLSLFKDGKGEIQILPITGLKYPGEYFDAACKEKGHYENIQTVLDPSLKGEILRQGQTLFSLFRIETVFRIDLIITPRNNIFFLEVNGHPGLSPCSILTHQLEWGGIAVNSFLSGFISNKLYSFNKEF